MRIWLQLFCMLGFVVFLKAQEQEAQPEAVEELPIKLVDYELIDQSLFVDQVATALIYFNEEVATAENLYHVTANCRILEAWIELTPNAKHGNAVAVVSFVPTKTGVVTLPTMEFLSKSALYRAQPLQFVVSEPVSSDLMSLELKPSKLTVYAGEPLRLDLTWDCALETNSLQHLVCHPDFFNDASVQVVAPRLAEGEDQIGLPMGGRRVIGQRTRPLETGSLAFGRVDLLLYLRFNEPGTYVIPETRLQIARLRSATTQFTDYGAYFKNSLFDPVEPSQSYDQLYTTADGFEIEVLPLPQAGKNAEFSGLFAPLDIEVSVSPTEVEIGQLMELEVKLSGDVPKGLLELPDLKWQPALRERFLVDAEPTQLWHEQGALFRTRLRVLTTSVRALPALQFQLFDPTTGQYVLRSTEPVPLTVKPSKGRDFIPLKSFEGAAVSLSNQPEGIWHNLEANRMNDLLNTLFTVADRFFLPLMLLGPVAFMLLLPVVRERRRRALDPRYCARVEAYARFKRQAAGSPEQWRAFLALLAVYFQAKSEAWTRSDSVAALKSVGASSAEIEQVGGLHAAVDAQEFGAGDTVRFVRLDGLAKRVVRVAGKTVLLLCVAALLGQGELQADDWDDAETKFAVAQQSVVGSQAATAAYTEAALRFQAVAVSGVRSGKAWYNAGNAWFQAGALGRSIAAYRQAQLVRPFDIKVDENLAAARAMTLNDVPDTKAWWQQLPAQWLRALLVVLNLVFWSLLLLNLCCRRRWFIYTTSVVGLVLIGVFGLWILKYLKADQSGVVIMDSMVAKKGPGYAYANAFNQALHDGLEFTLIEQRGDWALVELTDSRQCWLLLSQVQLIQM